MPLTLSYLTSPALLAQLPVIALVVFAAWFAGRAARASWQRRQAGLPEWQAALLEGLVRLVPALVAVVLFSVVHGIFAYGGYASEALAFALRLATVLVLARAVVYMVVLLVGPRSWVQAFERQLTLTAWLVIVFHMYGWFSDAQQVLDSIDLLPGKSHFTLWALLKSLVVVTGFVLVCTLIARAIEQRVMRLGGLALSTRVGIAKFTHFFLVSFGLLLGINAAGVDTTVLTLLTGAIGIGLGFGLQAIASNFVSGFVLLLDKSIKPGDVISFTGPTGSNLTGTTTDNFGWVQELRGRCVVVRDRDGVETLVPNQNLITSTVINWSYSDRKVRLKLPVRISYRDDPEQALQLLLRAVEGNARVLSDPAPVTRLIQFSDHGMDLELRFWIADPQNGVNNVRSEVNRRIWRLFRDAGITIPVAQHEVRLLGERAAP